MNQIPQEQLNGFAPNSQGRCVCSLDRMSLNVKIKDQRSRSAGTKNMLSAASVAVVATSGERHEGKAGMVLFAGKTV